MTIETVMLAAEAPGWLLEMRDWLLLNWPWLIRGVVEIGILTFGIYYAFQYLQRTRGWPVVVGFLTLLGLTLITELLRLQVLSWLLQAFFAFSVLAILIIFQPELRRLLAGLGNLPIFNTDPEQPHNVGAIVTAVGRLSKKKTGALLVIERAVDVHHDLHSNVRIDSVATAEMLESIFFPNSPLHDGGAIIQGDRITHAACIFPLTRRQDIRKTLGTRHRAAIGITEESDAIAVIVSEETGTISYCHEGALHRNVSQDDLLVFLSNQFLKEDKPGPAVTHWASRLKESLRELPALINKKLRPE
tara:strand:- start:650 stop:1558 length:909 start_codon:yes stop_codon:yes gene_type:complete